MSISIMPRVGTRTPSLDAILSEFLTSRGLYLLGAGTSAGIVPFGKELMIKAALLNVRRGSFPVVVPPQSELTRKSVNALMSLCPDDRAALLCPGRTLRPGTMGFPWEAVFLRQTNSYTQLALQYYLAHAGYATVRSDSYRVFRWFKRGVILNYNLDGLASDLCNDFHKIIAPHGTIERGYGSPGIAEVLKRVSEFNLPVPLDAPLLCTPESTNDLRLRQCLIEATRPQPKFVAIIGYSFGQNNGKFDDGVSWDFFCRELAEFSGCIYIIDPKPQELVERISETIKSNSIFGILAYWNVLSHAFIQNMTAGYYRNSVSYLYEQRLDEHGEAAVFPRSIPSHGKM